MSTFVVNLEQFKKIVLPKVEVAVIKSIWV